MLNRSMTRQYNKSCPLLALTPQRECSSRSYLPPPADNRESPPPISPHLTLSSQPELLTDEDHFATKLEGINLDDIDEEPEDEDLLDDY
jgi:hypothetical protein